MLGEKGLAGPVTSQSALSLRTTDCGYCWGWLCMQCRGLCRSCVAQQPEGWPTSVGRAQGPGKLRWSHSRRLWEDGQSFVGEASLSKLSASLRSFPDQGAAKHSTSLRSRGV